MKSKSTIFTLLLILSCYNLYSQVNYKFGHVDFQSIVALLPESETAKKTLETEVKNIQDQLGVMEAEYSDKINIYKANNDLQPGDTKKWSALVKADKEKEIQSLEQRIQAFRENANGIIAKKRNELLQPILEKVDKTIKEVAKENKFSYIFDVSSLLFFSDESIDITPMVKTKLSIK